MPVTSRTLVKIILSLSLVLRLPVIIKSITDINSRMIPSFHGISVENGSIIQCYTMKFAIANISHWYHRL